MSIFPGNVMAKRCDDRSVLIGDPKCPLWQLEADDALAVFGALLAMYASEGELRALAHSDDSFDRTRGHVDSIKASLMGGPRAK